MYKQVWRECGGVDEHEEERQEPFLPPSLKRGLSLSLSSGAGDHIKEITVIFTSFAPATTSSSFPAQEIVFK